MNYENFNLYRTIFGINCRQLSALVLGRKSFFGDFGFAGRRGFAFGHLGGVQDGATNRSVIFLHKKTAHPRGCVDELMSCQGSGLESIQNFLEFLQDFLDSYSCHLTAVFTNVEG